MGADAYSRSSLLPEVLRRLRYGKPKGRCCEGEARPSQAEGGNGEARSSKATCTGFAACCLRGQKRGNATESTSGLPVKTFGGCAKWATLASSHCTKSCGLCPENHDQSGIVIKEMQRTRMGRGDGSEI